MAGDKGAESSGASEFVHNPKAVEDALDFYKKPSPSNAFREAIGRAYRSVVKRKETRQLPSNETARRMAERMGDDETQPSKGDPNYTSRPTRTHPFMKMNISVRHQPITDEQKKKYFGTDQDEKKEPQPEE